MPDTEKITRIWGDNRFRALSDNAKLLLLLLLTHQNAEDADEPHTRRVVTTAGKLADTLCWWEVVFDDALGELLASDFVRLELPFLIVRYPGTGESRHCRI